MMERIAKECPLRSASTRTTGGDRIGPQALSVPADHHSINLEDGGAKADRSANWPGASARR
jgi:hypothetical protein